MKAIAKCPKCGKKLVETCDHCIESGTSIHKCKNKEIEIVDVEWKIIDQIPTALKDMSKETLKSFQKKKELKEK